MATFSTSHTCHIWNISDFSTSVMWRHLKFLHMWRNFRCLHLTNVEKSESLHIWHVCDVENVAIYATIYAIFATIYALSCGEKLSPKVHLWRKNDKYQVWWFTSYTILKLLQNKIYFQQCWVKFPTLNHSLRFHGENVLKLSLRGNLKL